MLLASLFSSLLASLLVPLLLLLASLLLASLLLVPSTSLMLTQEQEADALRAAVPSLRLLGAPSPAPAPPRPVSPARPVSPQPGAVPAIFDGLPHTVANRRWLTLRLTDG